MCVREREMMFEERRKQILWLMMWDEEGKRWEAMVDGHTISRIRVQTV